jgi:hypothetical protein
MKIPLGSMARFKIYRFIQEDSNEAIRPEEVWYMANRQRLRAVLMHNAECLDTALSLGILAYTTNPEVPYCNYKLVTNVIRALKTNVIIPVVYGLIYHSCQPICIQDSNHQFIIFHNSLQFMGPVLLVSNGANSY